MHCAGELAGVGNIKQTVVGTLHEWASNSPLKGVQSVPSQSRADCGFLISRPGHRTPPATGPPHSPHGDERGEPTIVLWIARTPEKRSSQKIPCWRRQRTRGAKCGSDPIVAQSARTRRILRSDPPTVPMRRVL